MKNVLSSTSRFTIRVLILIGLVCQVKEISEEYFTYKVTSDISFNITIGNVDKTYNLRFLYYEILNRDAYSRDNKDTSQHMNDTDATNMFDNAMNLTNIITIEDIFKYTPSKLDLIEACYDRDETRCDANTLQIKKYVNNMFVIYTFRSTKGLTYDEEQLFYTPNAGGAISRLIFKPDLFTRAFTIAPFLSHNEFIPYQESAIAIDTDTGYDYDSHIQSYLSFGLRAHSLITIQLPPPFTTKCVHKYLLYDCMSTCSNNFSVRYFDRLSPLTYFSHIDDYMKNMKIITFQDMTNEVIYRRYLSYLIKCIDMCPRASRCIEGIDITHIERSTFGRLNLFQVLSDSPSFIVKYYPKTKFVEYITLFMSCFGTWLGLSMIDMFPIKFPSYVMNMLIKRRGNISNNRSNIPNIEYSRNEMKNLNEKFNSLTRRMKQIETFQKHVSSSIM